jgi:hypothetical protein
VAHRNGEYIVVLTSEIDCGESGSEIELQYELTATSDQMRQALANRRKSPYSQTLYADQLLYVVAQISSVEKHRYADTSSHFIARGMSLALLPDPAWPPDPSLQIE